MTGLLACLQYNLQTSTCKSRGLAGLLFLLACSGLTAAELEISSGPGRLGPLTWESVEIAYRPKSDTRMGQWRLLAADLLGPDGVALGTLELDCLAGRMSPAGPVCDDGRINWAGGPLIAVLESEFRLTADDAGFDLELFGGLLHGQVHLPADGDPVEAAFEIESVALTEFSPALFEQVGLRDVAGALSVSLQFAGQRLQGQMRLDDAAFDSPGGERAGFGIGVQGRFSLDLADGYTAFSLELEQSAGELLFGPVYLPPPADPLAMKAQGRGEGDRWLIERIEIEDPGAVSLVGDMMIERGEAGWSLERVNADSLQLQLPLAWERWLDGPLASMGLADIETTGQINASGRVEGTGVSLDARLEEFYLDDPQGRFAIDRVAGDMTVRDDGGSLQLEWEGLSLYGLPSGGSSLQLAGDATTVGLVEPLRMPLLDGAVVVERLVWEHAEGEDRELHLDARIEPLDLAELTGLLGFPVFGGVLSGSFPGVRYVDEVLSFTGGIDVRAFSGRIEMTDLAIERPFGTLPALAAQVEFHRLDLAELTGAFNFGHMEGQASGWMRDLRLLDWRPVAMDARIYTHEDVRRRRISQRAVENLSNLGGAGGALITGTVLRVFDEFPYRRAGLACRLSNNICHIDGVALHESGGFYIVQGRSLPRLDIIGHRRLVDWPQLMGQLAAMMEE